ncbi:MAG: flagellar hook-associated protein FlgL [Planctomycetes bacterium]|nr:flagellar hook-associated protein FlgL [Planctomycetota bacterium]
MRVTMKMATNTAIDNILDNYSRLLRVQEQMAVGQRVINPSDDPLAANEGIRIQTVIQQISQYNRNIEVGESFLGLSDGALQDVNDILTNAEGLVTGMASETTTPDMRQATVLEIGAILEQLLIIGNRSIGDRYIFSGTHTNEEPFEIVGTKYVYFKGNENDISVQVDRNSYVPMNIKASDVFGMLVTTMRSDILTPQVNLGIDTSTRLEDLNRGDGVAEGSIYIEYFDGTITQGVEVNLSTADTLEDIADLVADATNDEVVVDANSAGTGLVFTNTTGAANAISISEIANNTTARDLGILGSSVAGNNFIVGNSVVPALTKQTLLADIPGYYGTPLTIAVGADDMSNPLFQETRDVNNNLSSYQLAGLTQGVTTDIDDNVYFSVTNLGGNDYQVEAFKDSGRLPEDRIAVGQVTTTTGQGIVTLSPDNGSGVSGTVRLNYIADDADINVKIQFPESYRATVQVEAFEETNDAQDQLSGWQLHGLQKGVDTDIDGKMYIDVVDLGGPPWTVRVYSDPTKTDLVASGSLAGPSQNGTVTLVGTPGTLHEHVTGSVDLQYLADDFGIELEATFATVSDLLQEINESDTYTYAKISDDGKAIQISSRLAGATLHLIQDGPQLAETNDDNDLLNRWSINGIEAGVNSGVNGELYADLTITSPPTPGPTITVNLYSDAAHTNLVATGSIANPDPVIIPPEMGIVLSEVNSSGINGSVNIDVDPVLTPLVDNDIELAPQDMGLSGKKREQNVFSTLTDVIDAGHANDVGTLHELLANFDVDQDRVLDGRAKIGSTMDRFEMMKNRLADEQLSFSSIFAARIDLDYADAIVKYQAESNIFNASLSVAGSIIPMSLVDFI